MVLECRDCCYCWQEEWERYPSCHFDADNRMPDDLAPCEYEEDDYE